MVSAAGSFARSLRNGGSRRVAEGEQDPFGAALARTGAQLGQSLFKCLDAKVFSAIRALEAVEKRSHINQLGSGIDEIEIQELLPGHEREFIHYKWSGDNMEGGRRNRA